MTPEAAKITSAALAEWVHEGAGYLIGQLAEVIEKGEHSLLTSEDAQNTARQVRAGIEALDEIGWPHEIAGRES
jgi:hypothetical protein